MAFRLHDAADSCPENPEALLRDLRKRTIPGLLSHQADLIRSYIDLHKKAPDVALQLPTGSGKTLVGLLIAEWRRRRYGERVLYLCPTNQLVHQVAEQATAQYGMEVQAFTGSKLNYPAKAQADWLSGEVLGITNYSSLFNTKPFFERPQLIVLDDAHSAENYISKFWSLSIEAGDPHQQAAFSSLLGLISTVLPAADRSRLAADPKDAEDYAWVEKLPTPILQRLSQEIVPLLDEHTQSSDRLKYTWSLLRDSLHACHLYVSRRSILIRPLIPPSNTHAPFAEAKQRIYMSATLGAGGDLERITGRFPIQRIPVPDGWDKQGIGRRFFIFPKRSLDDASAQEFVLESIKIGGRALYLVPDDRTAETVSGAITTSLGIPVFDASQIEQSKRPFVESEQAVAVVANRYDGIDLLGEDCRLLLMDGLPVGANLQERFLMTRVSARLLLEDRILTRVVQGLGRCTRSANDHAAVVILGENLNSYLFASERRAFFHPEVQAELQFGLDESRDTSSVNLLDNLRAFFEQNASWDAADKTIVKIRSGLMQNELPGANDLANAVASELAYQYAIWHRDFNAALEHCRAVLGKLVHPALKGYRALWLYLAGSAAWQSYNAGQSTSDGTAKDYYRQAQAAAPILRWLIGLQALEENVSHQPVVSRSAVLIERLEVVLQSLGMMHDRRYAAEEAAIANKLLQNEDGTVFEEGHKRLGTLLGFDADNSSDEAAPDPWWIVDDTLCFVFEDHAAGKLDTVFSVTKSRQAASHPNWVRDKLKLPPDAEVIPVLITPCHQTTAGALPHLRQVRYWNREAFRKWAQNALAVVRDVRREFTGAGDLAWRTMVAEKFRFAKIDPDELKALLHNTAADSMTEVGAAGEDV